MSKKKASSAAQLSDALSAAKNVTFKGAAGGGREVVSLSASDRTLPALDDIMKRVYQFVKARDQSELTVQLSDTVEALACHVFARMLRIPQAARYADNTLSAASQEPVKKRFAAYMAFFGTKFNHLTAPAKVKNVMKPLWLSRFHKASMLASDLWGTSVPKGVFPYPYNAANQCFRNAALASVFMLQTPKKWRQKLPTYAPPASSSPLFLECFHALTAMSRDVRHCWDHGDEATNRRWIAYMLRGSAYVPKAGTAGEFMEMGDPTEFLDRMINPNNRGNRYPNPALSVDLLELCGLELELGRRLYKNIHYAAKGEGLLSCVTSAKEFIFVDVGYSITGNGQDVVFKDAGKKKKQKDADIKGYAYEYPEAMKENEEWEWGDGVRYRAVSCVLKAFNAAHYVWSRRAAHGRWELYDSLAPSDDVPPRYDTLRELCEGDEGGEVEEGVGFWEYQPKLLLLKKVHDVHDVEGGGGRKRRVRK